MNEGNISVYQIAKQQNITPRWCRKLYKKLSNTPLYRIKIKRPGRKPKEIPINEINKVKEMKQMYGFGAVNLECVLDNIGMHIPHNKIHRILKECNLANNEPKKQKKRKWIRYERKHSNSLWHTDYHQLTDGKFIVPFLDDASRFITGYEVFDRETAENAVKVLDSAIKMYGIPKQVISDHGTQFTSLQRQNLEEPNLNLFQIKLNEYNIEHVLARVKHPQTNGKLERGFCTLEFLIKHFEGDIERAVNFYNFERPHMSLFDGNIKTPYMAFMEKMQINKR